MNNDLIDVQKLSPFTRFIYTIGELPSSYLMSMTYEEQLVWLCNYLATQVIPTINNNGQAVQELQEKYIELKSYVDSYFNNLDVQEEINNKLDEMAENGDLYNLINRFIEPEINEINNALGEQNTRLDTMESRISQITSLPDGSTSGDAELQDIRVGFDGTVYESAGDSVRGQVEFLDNQIKLKNKYKRLQVLTQLTSTFYKDIILPNHKYVIMYKVDSFNTSGYLCEKPTYISNDETNTRLWNVTTRPTMITINPKNMYRSLYIWNSEQNPGTTPIEYILYDVTENVEFEKTCYEIPLTFYNGGLTDAGNVSDGAQNKVYIPQIPLKGLYLLTYPDEIYGRALLPTPNYQSTTKIISYYHPMSSIFKGEKMMYCFGNKDNTPLRVTSDSLSNIHLYVIENNNPLYDIIIGSNTTPDYLKSKADIIVDDTNSTEILASIFGCDSNIKALILDGEYAITKFYTMEDGSYCSLPLVKNGTLQYCDKLVRRNICVEGRCMTTPQQENNVIFKVSESCHNAVLSNEYFILGTPYRDNTQIQRYHTSIQLSNINILGWLYNKPLTYIDLSSCLSVEMNSVNVRGWHENTETYTAFDDTPDENCTGIRIGRGNQYGIQNYLKHSNVWYCGKGIVCNGEHFVLEDVKAHHDYVGFYFGDKYTVGRMQHPIVMIGCSIEGCYRFMVLTKGGITTPQDWQEDSDDTGTFRSTLIVIGMSTENKWTIPTNEQQQGEPTEILTKPILEIVRGCYRGKIEMDETYPIFETDSGKGFIVYRFAGIRTYIEKGTNVIEN